MNSKDVGIIAESAVLHELLKAGLTVSVPYGDNAAYDLIVDTTQGLARVQVKTAHLHDGVISATTTFRVGSKRRGYSIYGDRVDYIAVYCAETHRCYAMKSSECGSIMNLRVVAPANNQSVGIKYASDYELLKIIK